MAQRGVDLDGLNNEAERCSAISFLVLSNLRTPFATGLYRSPQPRLLYVTSVSLVLGHAWCFFLGSGAMGIFL